MFLSQIVIVGNVWVKLGFLAVLSELAKTPDTGFPTVMAPQEMYKQMGEKRGAKGWTLALANMLGCVFNYF